MFQEPRDNSVAALVVGNRFTSLFSDKLRFLLDASDDPLGGKLEVHYRNTFFVMPGCNDGCLVADILDVCSAEPRSQGCQSLGIVVQINMSVQRQRSQMNLKYFFPSFQVRQLDVNKPVEAPRSGQGWI